MDRNKYRFWNTDTQMYLTEEVVDDMCFFVDPLIGKVVQVDHGIMVEEKNHIQAEQCTGLKDKNGQLIYEGDVVKGPYIYGSSNVFWDGIQWNVHNFDNEDFYRGDIVSPEHFRHFEIIGNIHENPELLK